MGGERRLYFKVFFAFMLLPDYGMSGAGKPVKRGLEEAVPLSSSVPLSSAEVTEALPLRPVIVRPMVTQGFRLPNQQMIHLGLDLDSILRAAVLSSERLVPQTSELNNECGIHVELQARVTTMQFDVLQFGLSFGYTPTRLLEVDRLLQTDLDIRVGVIAIDLSLWECSLEHCVAMAAATITESPATVDWSATINLGLTMTGPRFLYSTPIGTLMRKMFTSGIRALESSAHFHALSWQARVREVRPETGDFVFDAGWQSRIERNQRFVIYAASGLTGSAGSNSNCEVYDVVATARTVRVDPVSSVALIEERFGSGVVHEGDIVMVGRVERK